MRAPGAFDGRHADLQDHGRGLRGHVEPDKASDQTGLTHGRGTADEDRGSRLVWETDALRPPTEAQLRTTASLGSTTTD
jgi:hypothetical protein